MIFGLLDALRTIIVRYTHKIVKSIFCAFLVLALANLTLADDTSFRGVKVLDVSGKETTASLTFNDNQKAILVRPVKGNSLSAPYGEIDKCSYQYTRKHRIKTGFIVAAMGAVPVGLVLMFTTSKVHWLEVDYHEQNARKNFVLRMDKRSYPQILEAIKAHTGIEPEVEGNVDKRWK